MFEQVQRLPREGHTVGRVGGGVGGGQIEQDDGALLAGSLVELLQRLLQAHLRVCRAAGDQLAVSQEAGQPRRIEEAQSLGILTGRGQGVLRLAGVLHAPVHLPGAGTDLGVHAVQPGPQHRSAGVPGVRASGVE